MIRSPGFSLPYAGPPTVTDVTTGICSTGWPAARRAATTASSCAVSIICASACLTSSALWPGGKMASRGSVSRSGNQ